MNSCVRLAGDLPSIQKSFFRNFIAMLFAFFVLLRSEEKFQFNPKNLKFLILRATFGTMGILCNFYAVDHMMLSDASMLGKLSPFFAIIFSFFFLKEKIRPFQLIAIAIAFSGSLFIIKPTTAVFTEIVPALVAMAGGVAAGMAHTSIRILSKRGERGPFIVFFFSAFSCLLVTPFLIFDFHPMTWEQVGILLLAGLAGAGGQFSITAAFARAPAKEISVFDYTQVLFSALFGFFLFDQLPDGWSVLGYVIICGISTVVFLYNNHADKKEKLASQK